jgi:hypothetical protein
MQLCRSAGLRVRSYLPVVAALLGILGFVFAYSGAVMSGSFASAAAEPAATAYWRRIAIWYEVAAAAFLVAAVAGAGVLVRRALRRSGTVAMAVMLVSACGAPRQEKAAKDVAGEKAEVASPATTSAPSAVPAPAVSSAPHGAPASRVDTTLFGTVRVVLEDTTLALSDGRARTTTSLLEYINSSGDYRHTLLDVQRSGEGWIYLLIRTTGLSRADGGSGYCAAGEETDLVWAAVDPALRVARAQSALISSCLRTRDPLDDSVELRGEPWSITSYIPGDSLRTVSFDRRHPERGMRVTTAPDTARP